MTAADPLAGDPAAIRALARRLSERSESVEHGLSKLERAVGHTHDGWAGAAADRFVSSVEALEPGGRRIVSRIESASEVLTSYARTVDDIQREAERVRAAQASNADEIASNARAVHRASRVAESSDAVESDHVALQHLQAGAQQLATLQAGFDAQWQELVTRRAAADRAAAEGLADREVVGRALATASSLASMSDAAFLAAIAKLPADELATLGDGVEDRLANMPADQVAAWWDSMGGRGSADEHSAVQEALITAFPAVIGNLNGVAYWARDRANRISAQKAYAAAEVAYERAQARVGRTVGRAQLAEAERARDAARAEYEALKNFLAGARTPLVLAEPKVRQMVSFRKGHPPLGAFSVGDLDSASNVSYLVPGMGTTLGDTTQLMRASANVISGQLQQSGDDTAVVTWIGYEAPAKPPASIEVFGDAVAKQGGANLSADLHGLRSRRPDASLNVIAHSYGSTAGAFALSSARDLHVNSFVTLGSAGMPASVADATAIHADHMYAAQGDEVVAWVGRYGSRRANPADHFGAHLIDASAHSGYEGVTEHDLLIHNEDDNVKKYGYLDDNTSSLEGVVSATLR